MRALLGLALLTTGCLMAGNYHTARTLEKGTSQFGMTFSATQYTFHDTDSSGNTTSLKVAIPNLLPELTYHIGVSDDVEAGGRVALGSLGGEFDVKWRLLHQDKLHIAIDPALGYQAFIIIEGGTMRLPVILTYELAPMLDFTVAGFGSVTHFKNVNDGGSSSDFDAFSGTLTGTGGMIGLDLRGETFSIRPAVEFTRYVWSSLGNDPFNLVNYMVHIAWTGGREKKQLDRIERKIDNLQQQQSPYPYNPAPTYPPVQPMPPGPPGPPPSAPPPSEPPPQ